MSHKQYFKKIDPLIAFPPETYCPANNYYDILDANATEADVLIDKTFYADSVPKKIGSMPNNGDASDVIELVAEEIGIPLGYHNGAGVVKISDTEQAKIIAGNIKKDIIILGVTGTLESNPAIICPANGYMIDPGAAYVPPIDIGSPAAQEIYLLCDNTAAAALCVTCNMSADKYYAQIYDSDDVLIYTTANITSGQKLTYYFPQTIPNSLYVVKIKAVAGNFTLFKIDTIIGLATNWVILQAKFNTPNIVTLTNAFTGIKSIKSVIFNCTLNSLTHMDAMFSFSGIANFTFPADLPNITTLANMFNGSTISVISGFSSSSLPKLTALNYFAYNTKQLQYLEFPSDLPELLSMDSMCRGSVLRTVLMPDTAAKLNSVASAFYEAFMLTGTVTLPATNLLTTAYGCFYTCYNVEKVKFQGNGNFISTLANLVYDCNMLNELEMPRTLAVANVVLTNILYNTGRLEKIIFPDSWTSTTIADWSSWLPSNLLKSFTGTFGNTGVQFNFSPTGRYVATLNCPGMRCKSLIIGQANLNCPATAVEIDWANSTFAATVVPLKLYCTLDATELNRIFTALPAVVGKTMYIKGNPGTATCDSSIATAKGWTVNTTT